ncbi:MAG TPA: hypothetical protein VLN59_02240, partial [Burkholderiales bacterium]|nr:hypothetical protein [Burkholderiales bacterium]
MHKRVRRLHALLSLTKQKRNMGLRRYSLCLANIALVTGCAQVGTPPVPENGAPPAEQTAEAAEARDALADPIRLFKVTYPLLRAADGLCQDAQSYAAGL